MPRTTICGPHAGALLWNGFLVAVICLATADHVFADTFGSGANTFNIEFVTIGNPGNIADTTGDPNPAGSVPYTYRIGKYEISEDMVDKANASGGPGITHGNQGINTPVTYVSWFEAATFVNWLNTSTGNTPAYKFIDDTFALWQPGDAGYDPANLFRNTQAKYFLPTDNEWYKAAFYDPTKGVYHDYATGSDNIAPVPVASGTAPNTAVWRQFEQADITQAGGLSPYGTMAQGGNAKEWVETELDLVNDNIFSLRVARGGDADDSEIKLRSSDRGTAHYPAQEIFDTGLRVASTASLPVTLPGDYNRNGIVDAADYTIWRDSVGNLVTPCSGADANCSGLVENSEYQIWKGQFGKSNISGAGQSTGVPEPASVVLLLLATLLLFCFPGTVNRIAASLFLFCATCLAAPLAASAITIPTVPVGNVGNGNDPATGGLYGSVDYAYRIGTTEVTIGQYTTFLNAVAATDTYALYNPAMATDLQIAGIARSGSSGTYTYSPIGSANKPIAYVSWGDAARFCNWLDNGQPTGSQVAGTTEDGAYALNGAVTKDDLNAVTRKAGAKWFIPTENEWYKAAYHKNDGPTSNYWTYPTGTNILPNSDQPPGDPSIQTNVGNFYRGDGVAGNYNTGMAVTGECCAWANLNYLTDVGAYAFAPSPYGTFDQGGNLLEWNETIIMGSFRGLRGGSWGLLSYNLNSSFRDVLYNPTNEGSGIGFRVATVPFIAGDYNHDGIVDAADYTVWRDSLGQTGTGLAADGTGPGGVPDGVVDQLDFDFWTANFGNHSGAAASANTAVPEPTTLVLLFVGILSMCCRRLPKVS